MGLPRPRGPAPGKSHPGTITQLQPLTFSWVQAAAPRLTAQVARGRAATSSSSSRWRLPTTLRCPPPAIAPGCLGSGSLGRRRSRARGRASFAFPLLHPWVYCSRPAIASGSPPRCAAQREASAFSRPRPRSNLRNPGAGLSWEAQASEPRGRRGPLPCRRKRGRKGRGRGIGIISNAIAGNGRKREAS